MDELPDNVDDLRAELSRLLLAQWQDERDMSAMRNVLRARQKRLDAIGARLEELEG